MTMDPKVAEIQQKLGFVDDCAECNIVPVIGVFLDMAEKEGGLDTKALEERIGDPTTTPDEWMELLRGAVKSCSREHRETCESAALVLEALEQKLDELGAPFARSREEVEG